MAEGRVTNVVGQAGRLHDHAKIARFAPVRQFLAKDLADAHPQRAADAANFQRMGQARVDMVVAGNRMNLRLAPQAAKGTGEDDAVMVFVEGAAAQLFTAVQHFAESFTGKQSVPVQGDSSEYVVGSACVLLSG